MDSLESGTSLQSNYTYSDESEYKESSASQREEEYEEYEEEEDEDEEKGEEEDFVEEEEEEEEGEDESLNSKDSLNTSLEPPDSLMQDKESSKRSEMDSLEIKKVDSKESLLEDSLDNLPTQSAHSTMDSLEGISDGQMKFYDSLKPTDVDMMTTSKDSLEGDSKTDDRFEVVEPDSESDTKPIFNNMRERRKQTFTSLKHPHSFVAVKPPIEETVKFKEVSQKDIVMKNDILEVTVSEPVTEISKRKKVPEYQKPHVEKISLVPSYRKSYFDVDDKTYARRKPISKTATTTTTTHKSQTEVIKTKKIGGKKPSLVQKDTTIDDKEKTDGKLSSDELPKQKTRVPRLPQKVEKDTRNILKKEMGSRIMRKKPETQTVSDVTRTKTIRKKISKDESISDDNKKDNSLSESSQRESSVEKHRRSVKNDPTGVTKTRRITSTTTIVATKKIPQEQEMKPLPPSRKIRPGETKGYMATTIAYSSRHKSTSESSATSASIKASRENLRVKSSDLRKSDDIFLSASDLAKYPLKKPPEQNNETKMRKMKRVTERKPEKQTKEVVQTVKITKIIPEHQRTIEKGLKEPKEKTGKEDKKKESLVVDEKTVKKISGKQTTKPYKTHDVTVHKTESRLKKPSIEHSLSSPLKTKRTAAEKSESMIPKPDKKKLTKISSSSATKIIPSALSATRSDVKKEKEKPKKEEDKTEKGIADNTSSEPESRSASAPPCQPTKDGNLEPLNVLLQSIPEQGRRQSGPSPLRSKLVSSAPSKIETGFGQSSLPSSPLKRPKSANGVFRVTSEVFTRTFEKSGPLEVVYKQPSANEVLQRIATVQYTSKKPEVTAEGESSMIDTTDSSLSDSVALPSSPSDAEGSVGGNVKISKKQQQQQPSSSSPQKMKKRSSDITDVCKKFDMTITIEPDHDTNNKSNKMSSSSSPSKIPLSPSPAHVHEERISPILDVRLVTPEKTMRKQYDSKDGDSTKSDTGQLVYLFFYYYYYYTRITICTCPIRSVVFLY